MDEYFEKITAVADAEFDKHFPGDDEYRLAIRALLLLRAGCPVKMIPDAEWNGLQSLMELYGRPRYQNRGGSHE